MLQVRLHLPIQESGRKVLRTFSRRHCRGYHECHNWDRPGEYGNSDISRDNNAFNLESQFVFLAGGFAGSPWIFQEVGRKIAAQGLKLSRPDTT